jgi:dTDP-4-amino-4,6-dideoxygalactose transaminase
LNVEHLALFANGTIAMELALRALELPAGGRVITSPFTFVATANAISNAGLEPVFVDVCKDHVLLDPEAVEAAIDERTVAIAPVHVYGVPCDLDAFQRLADRHGLKLVYDAAHAFGTTIDDQCIGRFGHASMFSLHATKLFHAVECGLITSPDAGLIARLNRMKNFGYTDRT